MSYGHKQLHTVCARHAWRCFHCGCVIRCRVCKPTGEGRIATRDHFVPRSKGGRGGLNLVASCWTCNKRKGDGTPTSKRPKARSLGGCQFGRSSKASRTRRPRKAFDSYALAAAMVAVLEIDRGVHLTAWECPGCTKWHVTGHCEAEAVLRRDRRELRRGGGAA